MVSAIASPVFVSPTSIPLEAEFITRQKKNELLIELKESKHSPAQKKTEWSLEQREIELRPVLEKLERFTRERFSCSSVRKIWCKSLKEEPSLGVLRVVVLPSYAGLAGISLLSSLASLVILYDGHYGSAFSSDITTRVKFANTITNSGALFACVTDLPAITYITYLFVFQSAYCQAVRNALDESYEYAVLQDATIPPELREDLYQFYINKLQALGIDNYYLHPDPLCETGKMHQELCTTLQEIDQELQMSLFDKQNLQNLFKHCIGEFRKSTCVEKIGKVTVLTIAMSTQAIAFLLIIENLLLIKDTRVRDLFSSDPTTREIEASYLTQVGNLFCSVTSIGMSALATYVVFVKNAYRKTMRERIESAFSGRMTDLTASLCNAMFKIKSYKLAKF